MDVCCRVPLLASIDPAVLVSTSIPSKRCPLLSMGTETAGGERLPGYFGHCSVQLSRPALNIMLHTQITTCIQSSSLHIAPTLNAASQPKSNISTPPAESGLPAISPPVLNITTLQGALVPGDQHSKTDCSTLPRSNGPVLYEKRSRGAENSFQNPGVLGETPRPRRLHGRLPKACCLHRPAFVLMTRHQAAKALSGGSWPCPGLPFAPAPTTPQSRFSWPSGTARS